MIYGYTNLDSQKKILFESGAMEVFIETSEEYVVFNELVSKLKENDTLMICDLSVLGFSGFKTSVLIKTFLSRGIHVEILNKEDLM